MVALKLLNLGKNIFISMLMPLIRLRFAFLKLLMVRLNSPPGLYPHWPMAPKQRRLRRESERFSVNGYEFDKDILGNFAYLTILMLPGAG